MPSQGGDRRFSSKLGQLRLSEWIGMRIYFEIDHEFFNKGKIGEEMCEIIKWPENAVMIIMTQCILFLI